MSPQAIAELIDKSPYNRGMDGASVLRDPRTVALSGQDNACALFLGRSDGVFEGHWLAPAATAKRSIIFGRHALAYMFKNTNARMIVGLTPIAHRGAKLMNRWLGFKAENVIKTPHGDCQYFVLTRTDFERG